MEALVRNLAAVVEVQRLFPPGFSVVVEMMAHDVSVSLKEGGFFRAPAAYDPETETIELDPEADVERIAGVLSRRHGLAVGSDEVFVWLFLHELHHHLHRQKRLGVTDRNFLLAPTRENREEERQAEEYARKRFTEWKR